MRALWFGLIGAVLTVGVAEAVEGEYVGEGSEPAGYRWILQATIAPAAGGRYKAVVTSASSWCSGDLSGKRSRSCR